MQKISVIGGGMVGNAIASYYKDVKIYDKYKESDSIEEVGSADIIFIAVPTPYNSPSPGGGEGSGERSKDLSSSAVLTEGQDLTEMDDAVKTAVENLTDPKNQLIVLKSTIAPGTTEKYQTEYPDVNFLFNPEFLTESVAEADFKKPDKQLVGFTDKTKDLADKLLDILPDAPFQKTMRAREAEMVKYTTNSFYAFKVIFGNSLYDYCEKLGIDYAQVREGLTADSRIVDSHFDVFHGGSRGYDGKCLPKDIKTLAWLAEKNGAELKLIEKVIKLNEKLSSNKQ